MKEIPAPHLVEAITWKFNLDELKILFFDLGLEFESIPQPVNLDNAALGLVQTCERLNKIEELKRKCALKRPNCTWDWFDLKSPQKHHDRNVISLVSYVGNLNSSEDLSGMIVRLEQSKKQFERMTSYKYIHDHLQQLENSFQPVFYLAFDGDKIKSSADINWMQLQLTRRPVQSHINTLITWVRGSSQTYLLNDTRLWLAKMQQASEELTLGFTDRNSFYLENGMQALKEVIQQQISPINDRLIEAIDNLMLNDLFVEIEGLNKKIGFSKHFNNQEVFSAINSLNKHLNSLEILQKLRNIHNIWQGLDNELRNEQVQLFRNSTIVRFSRRWNYIKMIYVSHEELHDEKLAKHIEKVNCVVGDGSNHRLLEVFLEFYDEARQKFNNVDIELKNLCDKLKQVVVDLDKLIFWLKNSET
ncbi:MAG: hypothetical protein KIH69_006580 [Anaerolineae bacterium]|nr:hypothetical protein [Anaerolineae bacterium]